MNSLVANPYFQIALGALVSLGGSLLANLWFFGRVETKRAKRETWRAYNKLLNRLVQTSITDIQNPLHVMPVDISDRIEDLRFTLRDVNPEFNLQALVQQAIHQSAELRKKQEEVHKPGPRSG
jgi:hypothetical protein